MPPLTPEELAMLPTNEEIEEWQRGSEGEDMETMAAGAIEEMCSRAPQLTGSSPPEDSTPKPPIPHWFRQAYENI